MKIAVFVIGLTLLCLAITTLPLFADLVGWEIPAEYADIFSDLVIIGAVLLVSCKYIAESFGKFKFVLNSNIPNTLPSTKGGMLYDESKRRYSPITSTPTQCLTWYLTIST